MKPAGKLEPVSWMRAPETGAVMAALMADGVPARFVGGCVRDTLLGRTVKDIDIATAEAPDRVVALLEDAGLKAIPTGIAHGTITTLLDGEPCEITTLRLDVETFGRHARVAYTDDWEADAHRRDFTINALFCDLDGTLYDPTGGLADLEARRVRFVGVARDRIQEDLLRLLRFFRFHAYYGTGSADEEALQACRQMAGDIATLSAERIWTELKRLLGAPSAADVLTLMADWDVLPHVLPEAGSRDLLASLIHVEAKAGLEPDPVRRLSVLMTMDPTGARNFADRLRLSKAETQRLEFLLNPSARPAPDLPETENRAMLYRLGAEKFVDSVLLGWAIAGHVNDEPWQALLKLPDCSPVPDFPLNGDDVLALGIGSGQLVGALLAEVERWWIDQDFKPDRAACLAQLKIAARH